MNMQSRFKSSSGRTPEISRREKIVAGFAVAALLFSAAAYSSVPWQAQLVTLALSAASFAFLFLPVGDDCRYSKTARESWSALKRFPLFWFGLALFALMLVQGLNPAFGVMERAFYWKLYSQDFVRWLPSGVDAPYVSESARQGGMNAFRQMVVFGAPWLLLCALRCGVSRRRSWVAMSWVVAVFGVLLVLWGVGMRLSGRTELTPAFGSRNTSFFATFLYQNQAGAWISLVFAVTVSLFVWHWQQARDAGAKGGPHLVVAVIAALLVSAAPFTMSFGGMISLAVLGFVITPLALLSLILRSGAWRGVLLGGAAAGGMLALLAAVFAVTSDYSSVEAKLRHKFETAKSKSLDDRAPLRRATWELICSENGRFAPTGYGAGSYRWVSPAFLVRQPEFRTAAGKLKAQAVYAHCDWLQMLAEWGIAGVALVGGSILWSAWFFLKNIRRRTPALPILLGAIVLFMLHAGMDYLCYSMPLAGMTAFVFVGAERLGLLREVRVAGRKAR